MKFISEETLQLNPKLLCFRTILILLDVAHALDLKVFQPRNGDEVAIVFDPIYTMSFAFVEHVPSVIV